MNVIHTRQITVHVSTDDYQRLVRALVEERPPVPVFAALVVDGDTASDVHAERLEAIRDGRVRMRLLGERAPTRKRIAHPIG
jgi:hypothetical protein